MQLEPAQPSLFLKAMRNVWAPQLRGLRTPHIPILGCAQHSDEEETNLMSASCSKK